MLKNFWYPGCASVQLKNEPLAIELLDQKIAFFRDSNGTAFALKDRCCHRGLPLSKGKMTDGNLACGYHGWQFNGSGQCVKVPSQSSEKPIPKSHCIDSYQVKEHDGHVWIWLGNEAPRVAPSIPEFTSNAWVQGSRVIECNYLRALEITFDNPHVYFAHPTHPATIMAKQYGMVESEFEIRTTEKGCTWFAPPTASETQPISADSVQVDFELPGRIRFAFPVGPGIMFYMYFHTVSLGEHRCRIDWLIQNPNPTAQGVTWTGEGREVIGEDAEILELVEKTYIQEGDSFERSTEADLPTLTLRRVVKAAESGEWTKFPPVRRLFKMMSAAQPPQM